MFRQEVNPVLSKIREVIIVTDFQPPPLRPLFEPDGRRLHVPMTDLIASVERMLGVPLPPWLREVYLCCNGFLGQHGECILYPLDGSGGVGEFTLFLREEKWSPAWLKRAIVFGYVGGSVSTTTHMVALDGQLIEWCYGDDDQFKVVEGGLIKLFRRIQARWDGIS
jgi:hypothetical protein